MCYQGHDLVVPADKRSHAAHDIHVPNSDAAIPGVATAIRDRWGRCITSKGTKKAGANRGGGGGNGAVRLAAPLCLHITMLGFDIDVPRPREQELPILCGRQNKYAARMAGEGVDARVIAWGPDLDEAITSAAAEVRPTVDERVDTAGLGPTSRNVTKACGDGEKGRVHGIRCTPPRASNPST